MENRCDMEEGMHVRKRKNDVDEFKHIIRRRMGEEQSSRRRQREEVRERKFKQGVTDKLRTGDDNEERDRQGFEQHGAQLTQQEDKIALQEARITQLEADPKEAQEAKKEVMTEEKAPQALQPHQQEVKETLTAEESLKDDEGYRSIHAGGKGTH